MYFKFRGRHIVIFNFRFGRIVFWWVGTNGKPDTENKDLAFAISSISCLRVEKHAFKDCRQPYWFYPLPVWSHSILVHRNRKPQSPKTTHK